MWEAGVWHMCQTRGRRMRRPPALTHNSEVRPSVLLAAAAMLPAMSYSEHASAAPARPRADLAAGVRALARRAKRPELPLLVGLAAVLNLWALSRNGWANDYYAAAVRSMSTSWHD